MYTLKKSSSPLINCTWHVLVEPGEKHIDPATEYWSLAFARRNGGAYSVALVGPSLRPRVLEGAEGEQYWGVEFKPHVFIKNTDKHSTINTTSFLPTVKEHFLLDGKSYSIPSYEQLEPFVKHLEQRGALCSHKHIFRSLSGNDDGFSERSRQRQFKRVTGLSKKQVLQLQRARYAASLLRHSKSPVDVALQAGYADQAHLTHSLKRLHASTPSQIASQHLS